MHPVFCAGDDFQDGEIEKHQPPANQNGEILFFFWGTMDKRIPLLTIL
jgi:hypothetical protein